MFKQTLSAISLAAGLLCATHAHAAPDSFDRFARSSTAVVYRFSYGSVLIQHGTVTGKWVLNEDAASQVVDADIDIDIIAKPDAELDTAWASRSAASRYANPSARTIEEEPRAPQAMRVFFKGSLSALNPSDSIRAAIEINGVRLAAKARPLGKSCDDNGCATLVGVTAELGDGATVSVQVAGFN